ncbi:DUF2975 domain-containing protein [Christiangramia forsetii]|uniref:Membrane protein n=2 Tax=Christiangramia forsetii TaxID=411153 RepID=A0M795_CHRFK|nr:DUF2975 domain-containing protein [Christiangramia forsetii]GGG28407.1 hypothetical protein GCM10011532_09810 [Christiangramia forsetii]CAL68490.1 membrane protein [Christiangramia forsetii KT0803]
MKPPKFLKLIVNISYFLLALDLILSSLCYLYFLFGGSVKLESLDYITDIQNEESRIAAIVLFTLEIIYSAILFYAVYIIRKLIKDFEKERLYTKLQITGLNLAGKLIIGVFILQIIADFFTSIILDNRLKISLSFENDLGSPWLLIAIGLFLIYLSKIFKNSARLLEENELTV